MEAEAEVRHAEIAANQQRLELLAGEAFLLASSDHSSP